MKLDQEVQAELMKGHKERYELEMGELLDIPIIRDFISLHSDNQKGFTQTTVKREVA